MERSLGLLAKAEDLRERARVLREIARLLREESVCVSNQVTSRLLSESLSATARLSPAWADSSHRQHKFIRNGVFSLVPSFHLKVKTHD